VTWRPESTRLVDVQNGAALPLTGLGRTCGDCHLVAQFPVVKRVFYAQIIHLNLCTVLLMDDSRYPAWAVLVPRQVRPGIVNSFNWQATAGSSSQCASRAPEANLNQTS